METVIHNYYFHVNMKENTWINFFYCGINPFKLITSGNSLDKVHKVYKNH